MSPFATRFVALASGVSTVGDDVALFVLSAAFCAAASGSSSRSGSDAFNVDASDDASSTCSLNHCTNRSRVSNIPKTGGKDRKN